MSLVVGKAVGIPVTVLRYQNVYGPRQALNNPYTGVLSTFATQIRNGKPISVYEDGCESRDFVHISDAVEATILALESSQADGQVFNVGSGKQISILEVAQALVSELNPSIPIQITGEYRVGDIRHCFADLTKTRSVLGYSPQVPFESGIRDFARWVKTQPAVQDLSGKATDELLERGFLGQAEGRSFRW